jgi:3-oxoacyl-[acyl-carrier-protein] synthase-1
LDFSRRAAIFLGCSSIDLSATRAIEQSSRNLEKTIAGRVGNGFYLRELQRRIAPTALTFTYNTACTSSANALIDAALMLKSGLISVALVIGAELFTEFTLNGFAGMQLLSADCARPFDRDRDGIVLGEALSAVVMSVEASRREFLGGYSNCKTRSLTGSDPDGEGIAEVIAGALNATRIAPKEVDLIKAHGTSSALNDLSEGMGMRRVFKNLPPITAIKPYVGHTLGACGCLELALLGVCIDEGFAPKTLNFSTQDDKVALTPITENLPFSGGVCLYNYFGFGGNNSSFITRDI